MSYFRRSDWCSIVVSEEQDWYPLVKIWPPMMINFKREENWECGRLPLWSSYQSSWLQIQRFDSRRYQIFGEAVDLERPLSLVSTIEELLERKSSVSGLENREYIHRDPSHRPRGTLYWQKLALTSPASGRCSVGIVRSRTQATEFFFIGSVWTVCGEKKETYIIVWLENFKSKDSLGSVVAKGKVLKWIFLK
jgi:hypothetical protein